MIVARWIQNWIGQWILRWNPERDQGRLASPTK
jgi:hypothetical protein